MKCFVPVILATVFTSAVHAQTTSDITSQNCDVPLSRCTLMDSNADTAVVQGQWVYSGPVSVSIVTLDGAQPTKSCVAARTLVSQTTFKIVDDLMINCSDGSSLAGTYTATRSGSGRGGWAWHPHVAFESLVFY